MGNFSRDTFKLTNIMHQLLSGDTVTNPRHYVDVKLQQGVPLVDADWNELGKMRQSELTAILKFFIGNGVPAGNTGFQIVSTTTDNNFTISQGIMLVNGAFVINRSLTTYQAQPNGTTLPALSTPGADRTDLVYLDVWEVEVDGTATGDSRIVNELIGIETSVRTERKWVVKVEENSSDISTITQELGHTYIPLALLNRRATNASITSTMIVDQRKTGMTLSQNIKVPLFLRRGTEIINVERFVTMCGGLRSSLFSRLREGFLPYQTASTLNENVLLIALQEVMNKAHIGEVQASSQNMDNTDAYKFMDSLYTVQKEFMSIHNDIGNVGNVADSFIASYTKYLDGNSAELIKGLKLAIDNKDLIDAVIAQELINIFLSEPANDLPEGDVFVLFEAVTPFEALQAGTPYSFTFEIESQVSNFPASESEEFIIIANASASSWSVSLDSDRISLQNQGGKQTVTVTVTPNATETTATLSVEAHAVRNSLLKSTQTGISIEIGEFPPGGPFIFYSGPALNSENRLEIPRSIITGPSGVPIRFSLINRSTSEVRSYSVSYSITLDSASTTGWSPLESSPTTQTFTIPPAQPNPETFDARVFAPNSVAADTTGTLTVSATDVTGGSSGETFTVEIDFIVKA